LIVVKLPEAKKGSVLLPKHRLVERNFALTLRLRSLHFLAFASMMSQAFVKNNAHNL
jgi:hypothetical protein